MMYRNYAVLLAGIGVASLSAASQDHAFSVKDDIAMVRFSDPDSLPGIRGSDIVRQSPDGRHFAVVTTRGLLSSDQIESQLLIFDARKVETLIESKAIIQSKKTRVIATIIGSPHYSEAIAYAPMIKDMRWAPDLEHVYFKGENSTGGYQLYVASINSTDCHALTPLAYSVDRFDVESNTIAYTAALLGSGIVDQGAQINRDAWDVTGYKLRDIIFPNQQSATGPEAFSLWIMRRVNGRWVTKQIPHFSFRDEHYLSSLFPFKLSPNGAKLILLTPVANVPDLWEYYQPLDGHEHLRLHSNDSSVKGASELWKPQQYSIVDLMTGKSVPLVDAPSARTLAFLDNNRLTWADNGRRVLVTNTFLTLDHVTAFERSQRTKPCAVASVDIPSMDARCIRNVDLPVTLQATTKHVLDIAFGADNDEALLLVDIRSGKRTEEKYSLQDSEERAEEKYILHNGVWTQTSSTPVISLDDNIVPAMMKKPATDDHLQLFVKQSINEPPTLWVRDIRSGASRQLWDPNPHFSHILFGNASVYRWKDETGREWTGGLVKPVGYVTGRRYPLVIQMYSFYPDQFMTDGSAPTAFAARELASAGFMVLQIPKKADTLTDADPEIALEGYRSAVQQLSIAGLVDRSRVGVVGFSWTSWYVEYALITTPHLFAAATIADGLDNSYINYHLGSGSFFLQGQMEKIHGTAPFGEGLKTWITMAPGFHLDKVRTPVRIEAIYPGSVLQEWELYSSLQMQGKPVDMIYYPHGTHILESPLERLESQQGDVDWMRFWLQGYEDPDPAKASQYSRWRQLRVETTKENGATSESFVEK
jgi:dipeptidyl aminopeptidase/acylaminoacyl peptidase